MTQRISPTLNSKTTDAGKAICCAQCGHEVAPAGAGKHWKELTALKVTPVSAIPGWPGVVHPNLVQREFSCSSCGQLLDSEMALDSDPFLYDIVEV